MKPWNKGVRGEGSLDLINSDATAIRVAAGPGTGKTFGLLRRVQRLLHPAGSDLDGKEVLIVAFNRVIAQSMKREVDQALSESGHRGNHPVIRTVHALCLEVVGSDLRILLDHEREAMLYDVLESHPALREEYSSHGRARKALHQHEAKLETHTGLWAGVNRWLKRHHAQLISDLPGMFLDKLRGGDFQGDTYQHVIVDEFQDLTPGEQRLFLKLRRTDGSFLALGDPKQSIYRFRGNAPNGLDDLPLLEPADPITDIPMQDCHRCPPALVRAANGLMSLYPPPMNPVGNRAANLHVVYWPTPQSEAKGLARHIVDNIHANPKDRHLAMVTRRQFGFLLRDHVKRLDPALSVDLSFSESLLETWPVREAFLYFCLLFDPDPPTWRAWLGYRNPEGTGSFAPPRRNAQAYLHLLETADDQITVDTIRELAKEPRTRNRGEGGRNLWDRANQFIELENEFDLSTTDNSAEAVALLFDAAFWNPTGDETAALDLEMLRTKSLSMASELEELHPDDGPRNILQGLARRLRYLIATREPFEPHIDHDLQVATLWGAKGVTADHVYILGLCQAALPGSRRNDYPGTNEAFFEEQRRLFYVSITRARSTLVLSRAEKTKRGDALKLGLAIGDSPSGPWVDLHMTEFLRDIISFLPDALPGQTWSGCT